MNIVRVLVSVSLILAACSSYAADGLISVKSPYGAKETMDRFEQGVKHKGLTVFARVDHAAGAAKIGKPLRPTEVLIFGNPQGGTPFMECAQSVGIDLPLKALVWEDENAQVWVGYNDPVFLAQRHEVPDCPAALGIGKAVERLVEEAVAE